MKPNTPTGNVVATAWAAPLTRPRLVASLAGSMLWKRLTPTVMPIRSASTAWSVGSNASAA